MRAFEKMAEAQLLAADGQQDIAAAILIALRAACRKFGRIVARGLAQTPPFPL
jgi:hypothetical protein